MISNTVKGITRVYADENCKITNENMTFFADMIYLVKGDRIENYREVPRYIWKNHVEDLPTDFNILNEQCLSINNNVVILEEALLDTDYRLLNVELNIEYGDTTISQRMSVNYNMKEGDV